MEVPLDFARAWVEFVNPADADEVIRADLTWLTSSYHCIFGGGCAGIYASAPDLGCCTLGAHFADSADESRVAEAVAQLSAAEWELKPAGRLRRSDWVEQDSEGERKTRVVTTGGQPGCVFANRPGFAGGTGCALHLLAMRTQTSHVETKPDVCWQLPLRRLFRDVERTDGSAYLEVTITEYDRRGWGPGGHDLDWYCSGNPEAHTAAEPVFLTHAEELRALIGSAAYDELVTHCEAHVRSRSMLAIHPASR